MYRYGTHVRPRVRPQLKPLAEQDLQDSRAISTANKPFNDSHHLVNSATVAAIYLLT